MAEENTPQAETPIAPAPAPSLAPASATAMPSVAPTNVAAGPDGSAPTAPPAPDAVPGTPGAGDAKGDGKSGGDRGKGKRPFRDRPKQDRPKLDFTPLVADVKLRDLDQDIEAEMAAAISGFDSAMESGTPAEPKGPPAAKDPSGRKKGKILSIHGNDVFIDVPGGRSQGVMAFTQFDTPPKIGDEVEFEVDGYDGANGCLKLSRQGAAVTVNWSSVQIGQVVEARVTATNKGGLSVEVNGIRGFLPISQIDQFRVENLDQYLNQRLICLVAEVNPAEKNLVVSRRALLEQERQRQAEQFWATIETGQILKGTVRNIQKFGAFIDLGAADGLLPISELSWMKVGKTEDIVKIGDRVEVKVVKVDAPAHRLTLSLKALSNSPWSTIRTRLFVGSKVTGKVSRIAEFGAFVEIEPGIEGLIHISEMGLARGKRIREVLQEGKDVESQVVAIDTEAKRIGLSIRAIFDEKRKAEAEIARAEMAAREAAEAAEAAVEADKPRLKKEYPFKLRGGK